MNRLCQPLTCGLQKWAQTEAVFQLFVFQPAGRQRQTLQRAKNANTQPTHPGWRNSYRLLLNTSTNTYTEHPSLPTTVKADKVQF